MKTKTIVTLVVLALLVGVVGSILAVPPYPQMWRMISFGMSIDRVEEEARANNAAVVSSNDETITWRIERLLGHFDISASFANRGADFIHCEFHSKLGRFFDRSRNKDILFRSKQMEKSQRDSSSQMGIPKGTYDLSVENIGSKTVIGVEVSIDGRTYSFGGLVSGNGEKVVGGVFMPEGVSKAIIEVSYLLKENPSVEVEKDIEFQSAPLNATELTIKISHGQSQPITASWKK